jgi:hypothetical protein
MKEGNQMQINLEFRKSNNYYNKDRNRLRIKEIKEEILKDKLIS